MKTNYIKDCLVYYFQRLIWPHMAGWAQGRENCVGGLCGWGMSTNNPKVTDTMKAFQPKRDGEAGLYNRWKKSMFEESLLAGPWTTEDSWKDTFNSQLNTVIDQINKKKEESISMRDKLKLLVKEVISENVGTGYSNLQDAFPYSNKEEEKGEEIANTFNNYLTQFDNDPGYDTAVRFGKCLVHNKEMLRDILEVISSMEELKEEFIEKMKKLDVV